MNFNSIDHGFNEFFESKAVWACCLGAMFFAGACGGVVATLFYLAYQFGVEISKMLGL